MMAAILVALALAGVTIVAGLYSMSRPTPEQVARYTLGRFDQALLNGPALPPGETVPAEWAEALVAGGATTTDVELTYYPAFRELDGNMAVAERDWHSDPTLGTVHLVSGRWPQKNEAVVSADIAQTLGDSTTLTTAGGGLALQVVGIVIDDNYLPGETILAGQGTWSALSPDMVKKQPDFLATPEIFWSGGDRDRQLDSLAQVFAKQTPGLTPQEIRAQSDVSLNVRADIVNAQRKELTNAPAIGLQPLVATSVLVGAAAAAINLRWRRRLTARCLRIGLRRRDIETALTASGLASVGIGALVGIGVGQGMLWPVREAVVSSLEQAPAPVAFEWRVWGVSLVGILAGYLLLSTVVGLLVRRVSAEIRSGSASPRPKTDWAAVGTLVRRCAILALLGGSIGMLPSVADRHQVAVVMTLVALAAALTAVDVAGFVQRLGTNRLERLLARRGSMSQGWRGSGLTALTAGLLCLLSFAMTWWTSTLESFNASLTASTPENTLIVTVNDDTPDTLVPDTQSFVGVSDPVTVRRVDMRLDISGVLGVVENVRDLERLTGVRLSAQDADAMASGAALIRDPRDDLIATGESETRTLPVVTADFARELAYGGFVLQSTADRLSLPTLSSRELFYQGLSGEQMELARKVHVELGYSSANFAVHRPPDQFSLSLSTQLAFGGFGFLILGVVMFMSFAQARALRPLLAVTRAIGLPKAWLRGVLFEQARLSAGSAVLTAAMFQAVLILLLYLLTPNQVAAPWLALGLLLALSIAAVWLAPLLAMRRLTGTERELA